MLSEIGLQSSKADLHSLGLVIRIYYLYKYMYILYTNACTHIYNLYMCTHIYIYYTCISIYIYIIHVYIYIIHVHTHIYIYIYIHIYIYIYIHIYIYTYIYVWLHDLFGEPRKLSFWKVISFKGEAVLFFLYKGAVTFQSAGFLVKELGISWRKRWMAQMATFL